MQNLPQNHLPDLEQARTLVRSGDFSALELLYDNIPDVLSQLIRTAFIPKDGHKLIVADFSAIEARVIAWLAGEHWRNEVFATHGKIYEASASQMFSVPIEEVTKGSPLRQKGKFAELALGYGGSVGVARTTTMEAHLGGTANRLLEHGHDLVRVSDHLRECPRCRPWSMPRPRVSFIRGVGIRLLYILTLMRKLRILKRRGPSLMPRPARKCQGLSFLPVSGPE